MFIFLKLKNEARIKKKLEPQIILKEKKKQRNETGMEIMLTFIYNN